MGRLHPILPRAGECLTALTAVAILTFLLIRPTAGAAQERCVAQIWQNGALIATLPLDAPAQRWIQGEYANLLSIENGCARILESNCPGGDCLRCGAICTPERSIICLPNRLEIRICAQAKR